MTSTDVVLSCPSCGHVIGTLSSPGARRVGRNRSSGGPYEDLVRDWVSEDLVASSEMTTSQLHSHFEAWARDHGVQAGVSLKALAMGLKAAGWQRVRRRDGNYWYR